MEVDERLEVPAVFKLAVVPWEPPGLPTKRWSREEGFEAIRKVNGLAFRTVAKAYSDCRAEANDWPYGSDATWADGAGVDRRQVTCLSRLYTSGEEWNAFHSWSEAFGAVSKKLPPKDGRSTRATVKEEGKPDREVVAEVLDPEPRTAPICEPELTDEEIAALPKVKQAPLVPSTPAGEFALITGLCHHVELNPNATNGERWFQGAMDINVGPAYAADLVPLLSVVISNLQELHTLLGAYSKEES